jgi:hypothetical protein
MAFLPQKRASVVQRDLGNEAMLYDPEGDKVVRLNRTACRIWELCNGQCSLDVIAAQLQDEFLFGPGRDLRADVAETVAQFGVAQLLTSTDG